MAAALRKKIDPFFLRREKASTTFVTVAEAAKLEAVGPSKGQQAAPAHLPGKKQDFIVWLSLHPFQRQLYTVCHKSMRPPQLCQVLCSASNAI